MGCDIHMYIEYKLPGSNMWFGFGHVRPGRHYGVFAKLAGVRNNAAWGIEPIAEPRGMPKDAGFAAEGDYWMYITDDEKGPNYCTKADAERWVQNGLSTMRDGKWASDPDAHSASWATTAELEAVLSDPAVEVSPDDPGYRATLAAMKSLEQAGREARIVFWFDN